MTHAITARRAYIEYNKWLSKLFHNLFPDVDGGGGGGEHQSERDSGQVTKNKPFSPLRLRALFETKPQLAKKYNAEVLARGLHILYIVLVVVKSI